MVGDDDKRAYSQGGRKTTEPTVVLQCCIKFWHGAFPSVQGGRMVLYVPRFQHTACPGVGVCIYD